MAHYNYKELRDSLPPEMVDKWSEEDGSTDYDSTLWCYAADYIDQLTKERDEARAQRDAWEKVALQEASKMGDTLLGGRK
jgi:hypothetical protein